MVIRAQSIQHNKITRKFNTLQAMISTKPLSWTGIQDTLLTALQCEKWVEETYQTRSLHKLKKMC